MDELIYLDRNEVISFCKGTTGFKGLDFKLTYKGDLCDSIRGDVMILEDEFGSRTERNVSVLTVQRLKEILNSMIRELCEKDRDKYVMKLLKQASKKMIYGVDK